jgi:Polyketide cyclase / dehydrase and lipid transport
MKMTLENPNRSTDQASNGQRAVQAVALGAMMACAVAAPAAERAVSVVETVQLATTPTRAWAAIKDFGTWQSWHPAFASTQVIQGDGHSKGTVRVLTTKDGGKFTEELVAFDAASRSYQYRIIESPAPVADYVSTIQVKETKAGSTVVWSSRFNVKAGTSEADAKKLISGVYRAGLDNLASVLR